MSHSSATAAAWQPPSVEEIQAVLPQYTVELMLGRGGMGAVYKATQNNLRRPVAIKVLPADLGGESDAHFAERFKNEALTMARLSHPCIVDVHDFGQTSNGLLYIVMQHVEGTDLEQLLATAGRLSEDQTLSIIGQVCDALAYAHKNGVVHRDIKPANILIDREGGVKVADFGLAKVNDSALASFTKTNVVMGTPDFLSPEALLSGIPLDGRADLYAVGVMFYQMLTGEIPRGAWTLPSSKVGSDPRLDAIITRAMQADRALRHQTAAELRQEINTIVALPRQALIAQLQAAAEASAAATRSLKKSASGGQRRGKSKDEAAKPTERLHKSTASATAGMRRSATSASRKRSSTGATTRVRKKGRKRRIAAVLMVIIAILSALIGYLTGSGLSGSRGSSPPHQAPTPVVPPPSSLES